MKRVLPIWFLAAVLGGCGLSDGFAPPDTSMSSAHREVNLTLRHTFIEDRKQSQLRILSDIVDQLENEHPGLNIEMEGIQDTVHRDQKLPAEMVQGNPPDIFDLFGGSDTKRYARAGMLLDLTPFLKDMGWSDYFVNLEEFTVDGRVYGLPIAGYAEGVFYNKALFRTHGWDVPATWDDLLAIVEEAKAAGVQPFALAARDGWVNGMMWNTIMIRTAGMDHFKGLLSGESKWTDEEFVRAFEHYETLVDMGAFPEGALGFPPTSRARCFLRETRRWCLPEAGMRSRSRE